MSPQLRSFLKFLPSLSTAELVCAIRGRLAHDGKHPLAPEHHDPFAASFCGAPLSYAFMWPPLTLPLFHFLYRDIMGCSSPLLLRAACMERYLKEAVEKGVEQYVMVAAGMDSFVVRKPQLASRLQVFELDLSTTQAKKKACLERAGVTLPDHVHLIPTDLTTTTLKKSLQQSAFDFEKKTFFSMMGISYYLTPEVFYGTAQHIKDHFASESMLVFDYLLDDASLTSEQLTHKAEIMKFVADLGEPMIFETSTDELRKSMEDVGFSQRGHHLFVDLNQEYGVEGHGTAEHTNYGLAAWQSGTKTTPSQNSEKSKQDL